MDNPSSNTRKAAERRRDAERSFNDATFFTPPSTRAKLRPRSKAPIYGDLPTDEDTDTTDLDFDSEIDGAPSDNEHLELHSSVPGRFNNPRGVLLTEEVPLADGGVVERSWRQELGRDFDEKQLQHGLRTICWTVINGKPHVHNINSPQRINAVCLQVAGSESSKPCRTCIRRSNNAFQSCVVPRETNGDPEGGRAACANCVWRRQPNQCSLVAQKTGEEIKPTLATTSFTTETSLGPIIDLISSDSEDDNIVPATSSNFIPTNPATERIPKSEKSAFSSSQESIRLERRELLAPTPNIPVAKASFTGLLPGRNPTELPSESFRIRVDYLSTSATQLRGMHAELMGMAAAIAKRVDELENKQA
ncbi:hypothetical protein AJ80_09670 [Polytolypa hystricis UAMH7299]|uniref:Uncharacterized protein n=1 Tax=Polytolypa hystricis (strain UAMH7299) TaxID=1447883 RepID=A0A2B7WDS6_POLH7|nr:hypothetical protein AJ80_09670 [Polytolypa hystricis UAMH7299]